MYRITELGRAFGLSRSTLLYYDRIGLLSPSARDGANYRRYSEADRARLEAICALRQAGLALEDIGAVLADPGGEVAAILQRRLKGLAAEIRALQAQQRLLADMLQFEAGSAYVIDKQAWVAMLRAAGMDEAAMDAWHRAFEARAPEAHGAFLASLGMTETEIARVRGFSRINPGPGAGPRPRG